MNLRNLLIDELSLKKKKLKLTSEELRNYLWEKIKPERKKESLIHLYPIIKESDELKSNPIYQKIWEEQKRYVSWRIHSDWICPSNKNQEEWEEGKKFLIEYDETQTKEYKNWIAKLKIKKISLDKFKYNNNQQKEF